MTAPAIDLTPQLARRERLFVGLRFFGQALLASVASLSPGQDPASVQAIWTLAAAGAAINVVAWLLLRLPRTARAVALVSSAFDGLLLAGFIVLSGGINSLLWWFVFVLVAAATLRHGVRGGLTAALAFGLFYAVMTARAAELNWASLYRAAVPTLAYAILAATAGWIARQERDQAFREREATRQTLQRTQSDVKSLAQLSGTVSGGTDYQTTLQQMLELSLRGLRARGQGDERLAGMILLLDKGESDSLTVAAASGIRDQDKERRVVAPGGVVKTALTGGGRQTLADARADPVLRGFATVTQATSAVVLPLRAALTLYGAAVFLGGSELPGTFERRRDLIEAYAAQAAIAVQNARLFEQLREERDRFVDSEERARQDLARELHDGPLNQVASLTMGIDFARRLLDREPDRARDELESMHRLAAKTARDMRMTMYRLRPLALEQEGLTQALEQFLSRLQAEHERPRFQLVAADSKAFEPRLPPNAAVMVFDIMTEAVNNAVKHARAETVRVELRAAGDYLVASASDDGRGFDVAQVSAGYADRGSLGLVNIRERAELAHGEAVIESAPGKGSVITVRVPLARAA